ncbi:hypothetical protein BJX65DRAFT_302894 [Aspergillus insuetus]
MLLSLLDTLGAVDLYDRLSTDLDGLIQTFGFNRKQREANDVLRHLPGPVAVIQGPPGTGKTYWLVHSILPLLTLATPPPTGGVNQVAIVGPTYTVADQLAQTMQDVLEDLEPAGNSIVVRCHAITTEESLALAEASARCGPPETARAPIIQPMAEDPDVVLLDEMHTARLVTELHAAETEQPAGAQDRRVIHAELSLGNPGTSGCWIIGWTPALNVSSEYSEIVSITRKIGSIAHHWR